MQSSVNIFIMSNILIAYETNLYVFNLCFAQLFVSLALQNWSYVFNYELYPSVKKPFAVCKKLFPNKRSGSFQIP